MRLLHPKLQAFGEVGIEFPLANGGLEFRVVDLERKNASVVRREGAVVVYSLVSVIPLDAFGAGEVAVDEIFA